MCVAVKRSSETGQRPNRPRRPLPAVTDSSKLLRRNLSVISPVEQVDLLITDRKADAQCIAAIRARGVEVMLV